MVFRHLAYALASCLVACAHFVAIAPVAVFDAIATAIRWLAAPLIEGHANLRLTDDGGTTFASPGEPLDNALVNSLRHEAGMRRLRC